MSLIVETVKSFLPAKRKQTPSGWISFNAPCCVHNGNTADTRQRGGFIINGGEALSYHCFNCQFKCSWQPGRPLSKNMKNFMKWIGIPDSDVTKLAFEAMRLKEDGPSTSSVGLVPQFTPRALPLGAKPIEECLDNPKIIPVLEYLQSRQLYLEDYPFYWTDEEGFENRLIVPFVYKGIIVGSTARKITPGMPKYISEQQPGYVFNLDSQGNDKEFVIAVEGPFCAIAIGGVSLLGAEIKAGQSTLIQQLGKEVIYVPDRDKAGLETVEKMLDMGINWTVSMPDWPEGIKDVNDAVIKLGRLATLYLIVSNKLQTELKIRLRMKNWLPPEDENT
jgi:hypothetical protein